MLKILNAEPGDYSAEAESLLSGFAAVHNGPLSRGKLKAAISGYDVLITRLAHRIDEEILKDAANLKAIVTATTGLNHIDLSAAQKRNIEILSLKGEHEFMDTIHATAEHTIGLMLALLRHIPAAACDVHEGHWNRDAFKGRELRGRTLGIIGFGRLGRIVAGYANAFGMNVLAFDKNPSQKAEGVRFTDLDTLLAESDIASLHASFSPENAGMIGESAFAAMKKGALFINTARGELVDETALLQALEKSHLAGAALDVLKNEHEGHKNWLKKDPLWKYARKNSNLLITPHIGGATYDSMKKTEIFMARKLQDWALKRRA
ncbi:MAG: NAD(P)-dependent oxidoreductase [Alphaproteobacteria bacterium]